MRPSQRGYTSIEVGLLLCVGWLDYLTGPAVSFFVLYLAFRIVGILWEDMDSPEQATILLKR
jgi:hypothetical protein